MSADYLSFIASKRAKPVLHGFDLDPISINPFLKDFQRTIVPWSAKRGRSAIFAGCGFGKSLMQLVWGEHVVLHTNKPVLLLCPLGVRRQMVAEAEKFNIGVNVQSVSSQEEVIGNGIFVTNYERLHCFDASVFAGVILDESSLLKSFAGKIRTQLIELFATTPYRLCCTATPAPNDHIELGNHAEFLGVCTRSEMLSKYFINDTGDTKTWKLKGHAVESFWEWVASWAVCISKPSDIGGDDSGYELPTLTVNRHTVTAKMGDPVDGFLFNVSGISATNIHEEKRMTLAARIEKAVEIRKAIDDICLVWCDTNYEADALKQAMPDAIDVRGTDTPESKEDRLLAFANGDIRTLISKPSIAGFGMNFQVCHRMVFAGLAYSFEAYYQSVRRCWRFGQSQPVTVDIVLADTESAIHSAIARKESDHQLMQDGMAKAMLKATLTSLGKDKVRTSYSATSPMMLPSFLSKETIDA